MSALAVRRLAAAVLMAAVVTAALPGCAGPRTEAGPTTTVATFDAIDCGAADSPVAGVRLLTDIASADPRLSILRCAIEVSAAGLAGDSGSVESVESVVPLDVVAGATVDSLGALMVQLDPTLTVEEVAGALTRVESAVFTAPIAVAIDLARVRADATAAPSERWLLTADVAHEMFHVVQWRAVGGDGTASRRLAAEPFWLVETAPQWFADRLMAAGGFAAEQRTVAASVDERSADFPGLARWETAAGFGTWDPPSTRLPTALRFAALPAIGQLLVDRAGPDSLLHDYWVERAVTTEPWPVTFERVFGLSVAEFYAEVDRSFAER
ncbi:MAG: hypothetical protein FGM58_04620 [Acidimicrobiia bacterium]|nr:hypothetical protein [Acidimicrobiia bacterium]